MEIIHIWNAWTRIRRRMGSGFNGPVPITWTEIDAFLRRSGERLSAYEVDFLEIIDDAYLASFSAGPSSAEQAVALKDSLGRISQPQER